MDRVSSFLDGLSLVRGTAALHFALIELAPLLGLFGSIQALAEVALVGVYSDPSTSPLLNNVTGPMWSYCLTAYAQGRYLTGATTMPDGCRWQIGPSPGVEAASASAAFGGPEHAIPWAPQALFILSTANVGVFYAYMVI